MKTSLNQRGSSYLVTLLAVAVLVAVGAIGYRVVSNTDTQTPDATTSISTNNSAVPDSIKSTADLNRADSALDGTTIDSSVNPNQLDGDINDLL